MSPKITDGNKESMVIGIVVPLVVYTGFRHHQVSFHGSKFKVLRREWGGPPD